MNILAMDDNQLDGLFHKHLAEYTAPDEGAVANWQRMQLRMGAAPDRRKRWLPWLLLLLLLGMGSGMFWYQQQQIQHLEATLAALSPAAPKATSSSPLSPQTLSPKPAKETPIVSEHPASEHTEAYIPSKTSDAPLFAYSQVLKERVQTHEQTPSSAPILTQYSYEKDYDVIRHDWRIPSEPMEGISLSKVSPTVLADSLPDLKTKRAPTPTRWFTKLGVGAGLQTPWVDLGVGQIQTTLGIQAEVIRKGRLSLQIGVFTDPYSYRLDAQRINWFAGRAFTAQEDFENSTDPGVDIVAAPITDSSSYLLAQVEAPGIAIPIRLTYDLAREGKIRPYLALGILPRFRTNLRTLYSREESLSVVSNYNADTEAITPSQAWELGTYQAALGINWRISQRSSGTLEAYTQFRLKGETVYRGTYRSLGLRASFWINSKK